MASIYLVVEPADFVGGSPEVIQSTWSTQQLADTEVVRMEAEHECRCFVREVVLDVAVSP